MPKDSFCHMSVNFCNINDSQTLYGSDVFFVLAELKFTIHINRFYSPFWGSFPILSRWPHSPHPTHLTGPDLGVHAGVFRYSTLILHLGDRVMWTQREGSQNLKVRKYGLWPYPFFIPIFFLKLCFSFFWVSYHSKWILVRKQTLENMFEANSKTPKLFLSPYLSLYIQWTL